jgi:outer membrane protein OmpA-like peptidoglycan-associated protein
METKIYIFAVLAVSLGGAACASKKYVNKTVAPVEQRVTSAEAKNLEQDQKIATQAGQLEAVDRDLSRTKERLTETYAMATAMNNFKMVKSGVVLFAIGQKTLGPDAKAALDEFARAADGQATFVIEVQGFADRTGGVAMNEALSQARAQSVARYLAKEHMIPLRHIAVLGAGVAPGAQRTRDELKQSRKVDFRMWLPQVTTVTSARN